MSNLVLKNILENTKEDIQIDELYALLKKESDEILAMMVILKAGIINLYENDPDSIHSVTVVPTVGRKTTAWKDVVEEAHIPDALIAKYTKVGKPGYAIQKLKQNTNGDNKFISA